MRPVFRVAAIVGFCLSAALFGGCGKPPEARPPEPAQKPVTIAVIPKATTHSFWQAVESGARKAAQELRVQMKWQGPVDDSKIEEQISILNELVASGVNGIVLSPCDDKALAPHVRAAMKKGIPVVIFDSPLDGRAGVDFVNLVATQNRQAGEVAADTLAGLIEKNRKHDGKILFVRFTEGSASTRLREEAFAERIAQKGSLSIAVQQFTDGSSAGAQSVAETLLGNAIQDNAVAVDGIFASNGTCGEGTLAAVKALQEKGVRFEGSFVAFDDTKPLVESLEAGLVDALVVQDAYKIGYLGVKSLVDHLNKKPVEPFINTGVTVRTASPAASPAEEKNNESGQPAPRSASE